MYANMYIISFTSSSPSSYFQFLLYMPYALLIYSTRQAWSMTGFSGPGVRRGALLRHHLLTTYLELDVKSVIGGKEIFLTTPVSFFLHTFRSTILWCIYSDTSSCLLAFCLTSPSVSGSRPVGFCVEPIHWLLKEIGSTIPTIVTL